MEDISGYFSNHNCSRVIMGSRIHNLGINNYKYPFNVDCGKSNEDEFHGGCFAHNDWEFNSYSRNSHCNSCHSYL